MVDVTGDLVLLGEEFFTTRWVRFNKDNTVTVEIPFGSAEIDAALGVTARNSILARCPCRFARREPRTVGPCYRNRIGVRGHGTGETGR